MEPAGKQQKLDINDVAASNASYHGMFYHLRLGMVILLHSFNLHRKRYLQDFRISMEERDVGKFNGVVIQYRSALNARGTIYIQTKHKSKDNTKLTVKDFFPKKSPNDPFSVFMYFESFLDHYHPSSNESRAYLLCTNATINQQMMQYFTLHTIGENDILWFCNLIGASCYTFKREDKFTTLLNDLRSVSLEKLGRSIVSYAKTGQEIDFNNKIFCTYSNLIASSVQHIESNIYTFNEQFWTACDSTPLGMLRIIVERQYGQLPPNKHTYKTIQIAISPAFIASSNETTLTNSLSMEHFYFEQIDRVIHQFCNEFMLVCGSKSESHLPSIAHGLVPNWVLDKTGAFENLQTLLLEELRGENSNTISLKFLQQTFFKINPNENFKMLQTSTQEHAFHVRHEFQFLNIQLDRLKSSSLFLYLNHLSSFDVYRFRSTANVSMSSTIILHTSETLKAHCLFINSSSPQIKGKIYQILQDMMEFISDVGRSSSYIAVIYGQLDRKDLEQIKECSTIYKVKCIFIQELTEDDPYDECFLIRDLTNDGKKFINEHIDCSLFGTTIPLNRIVRDDDTLSFLHKVLTRCEHSREQMNEYSNKRCYENILSWYILRSLVPYEQFIPRQSSFGELFTVSPTIRGDVVPIQHYKFLNDSHPSILTSCITSQATKELIEIPEIKENTKVFIVLDDAGYGKSTFFISLAASLSTNNPLACVIRLIALNYSTDFARLMAIHPNTMYDITIIRIFFRLFYLTLFVRNVNSHSVKHNDVVRGQADAIAQHFILSEGKVVIDENKARASKMNLEQMLSLRLFEEKFNEKQFILLLDGFDEVAPHYKDFVMNYFARISTFQGIRSLYIFSRPYDFVDEMKSTFMQCQLYRMEPFSVRDRVRFLHNYFNANMVEYRECSEYERLILLASLHLQVEHKMVKVKGIPLFLYMGTLILAEAIRKYVNFDEHTLSLIFFERKNFNMLAMFQHFAAKKLKILHTDKTGATDTVLFNAANIIINEDINQQLLQRHSLLGAWVMFKGPIRAKLLTDHEQQEALRLIEYLSEAKEKVGFILGVEDGMPLFTHRICAEYFAACWLYDNKDRMNHLSYFRSRSYWSVETFEMRDFFDRMILAESVGCDLHMAVINKSDSEVREVLSKNPLAVLEKDALGRLPLHLAVDPRRPIFLSKIFEKMSLESINTKDLFFQWSPLDYAFASENEVELLEENAIPNIDNLQQQILFNDLEHVLLDLDIYKKTLTKMEKNENADELVVSVVKYLLNERRIDIYSRQPELNDSTILEFCTKHNMIDALKHFQSQTSNPKMLSKEEYELLFYISIQNDAYDAINYYMNECHIPFPDTPLANDKLISILNYFIDNENLISFRMIIRQFNLQLNIANCELDNDEVLDKTLDLIKYKNPDPRDIFFDTSCCVESSDAAELTLPEYSEKNVLHEGYIMESLLARAVHVGNVEMVLEIVHHTKTKITNKLILTVMRLLPKGIYGHGRSVSAFHYLLDHSIDLEDTDEEGRNLLHITAQFGCIYMFKCLVSKGFEVTAQNVINGKNSLDYAASSSEFRKLMISNCIEMLNNDQESSLIET